MSAVPPAPRPAALGPAAIGRRIAACLIDYGVAALIMLLAVGGFVGVAVATAGAFALPLAIGCGYLILVGWLMVYTVMQARGGSIGMRMLGLRLVRPDVEGRLGFGRALARNVAWALGAAVLVGMFSPLMDSSPWRRGWHDKAAGAVMIDIAGHPPAAPVADPARSVTVPPAEPSVLPAAPILPPAAEIDGRTLATARSPRSAAGLIAFVPGISRAERLDPSPPAGIPVVDAPPPGPRPASASAMEDPLEQTRLSTDERPLARLIWDDGTRQAVHGRCVFGRNPTPETGAMVVPVRDETLSLSKTHFELDPDETRSLWVIDRHSTNGVTVRRGIQRQAVVPGERTRVRMGDVLEFGDRSVTIEVAP